MIFFNHKLQTISFLFTDVTHTEHKKKNKNTNAIIIISIHKFLKSNKSLNI